MLDVNLKAPEHYINRELSFLDFNLRVLSQVHDESLPLLERIRFLGISCSNLDEFFEIRVAGLKQRQELGSLGSGPDGMSVPEQLAAIHKRALALVEDQYQLLNQLGMMAHFISAAQTGVFVFNSVETMRATGHYFFNIVRVKHLYIGHGQHLE